MRLPLTGSRSITSSGSAEASDSDPVTSRNEVDASPTVARTSADASTFGTPLRMLWMIVSREFDRFWPWLVHDTVTVTCTDWVAGASAVATLVWYPASGCLAWIDPSSCTATNCTVVDRMKSLPSTTSGVSVVVKAHTSAVGSYAPVVLGVMTVTLASSGKYQSRRSTRRASSVHGT